MISSDVRRAVGRAVAAAGLEPADPRLRPTGTPGQYASSVAFALGETAERAAARIAASLTGEHIGSVEITGPGFITVTVPPEALANLPERIIAAGPACASSDALLGRTVPAPPRADALAAPDWEKARATLAAQLTAGLSAAAGATVALHGHGERSRCSASGPDSPVVAAAAFAGADAVRFSLARENPGRPAAFDQLAIARQVISNPAYAVRYAHARAASELRWAISREAAGHDPAGSAAGSPRGSDGPISRPSNRTSQAGRAAEPSGGYAGRGAWSAGDPGAGSQLPRATAVLLDALSWLPERAAAAARRGRPDEFARFLEELAGAAIAALIWAGNPGSAPGPGTDRLGLAGAARTGLAAGLGLLGISAPDRL